MNSRVPIFRKANKLERICEVVCGDIAKGVYTEGQALPTAEDLAERHKVSAITVRRAMRNLSDAGALRRVPGKGTFVSDLIKNQTRAVKIGIMSYLPPAIFADPAAGANQAAKDIFNSFYGPAEQFFNSKNCAVHHLPFSAFNDNKRLVRETSTLDGLFVSAAFIDNRFSAELLKLGKPVVVVQHSVPFDEPFHQVIPDFTEPMLKIAWAMIRSEKKIILISRPGIQEKEDLFLKALGKCGVSASGVRIENQINIPADIGQMTGYRIGQKILREEKNTAVFSTSDFISFGLINAFDDAGLKRGEIPLVSIDDLEGDGILPFGAPFLTTIKAPRRRISELAAELLFDSVSARRNDVSSVLRVKTELTVRESSGALKL
jgi:DNA-binding LacI/PurR family transcriptional regulator